ncbi:MAG: hypothetical protein ACRBN8_00695 [Nannocystales bacterium]
MRRIIAAAGAVCLGGLGCARLNPEFASGQSAAESAQTSSGSSRGGSETDANDLSSAASASASDSTGDETGTGPGPHVCGNGDREPGEECDDGNLDWGDGCDEYCEREPYFEWVHELDFEDGIAQRFNDVALVGDVVVAAGRGEDVASPEHLVRLVSLATEDGSVLDELTIGAGAGIGGEARGVAARGAEVYFAGRSNEPGVSAVVGMTELDGTGAFGAPMDFQTMGTRSKGIAFQGSGVLVTNGQYNADGFGLASCSVARGCTGWVSDEQGSQLDAVATSGEEIFVAGLRGGSPHIFEVVDPTHEDGLLPVFDDLRPGRFQALAIRGDTLYAAGSVVTDGDEDAWVVAYSLSKADLVWEERVDGGSMLDDEFEDLALTDDGSLVVVGMLGTPPVPVVFEYGPQGAPRWGLSSAPGPGVDSGHARGVAVDGEAIYVAGEWRETYSPGDGAEGTSVGFVAKIFR